MQALEAPDAAQPNTALWFESIHFLSLNDITRLNGRGIPVTADLNDARRQNRRPPAREERGGGRDRPIENVRNVRGLRGRE